MKQKFQVLKHINYAINEYRQNKESDKFKKLCQEVIDSNDAKANIKFVKSLIKVVPNLDIIAYGRVVLEYGDVEDNYDYARFFKGADTRAHREKIIESKSVEFNLYAGKSVEIKDELAAEFVNRHGEVVAQYGGFNSNYEYLRKNNIEGFDKQPHLDKIIQSGSALYNLKTAQNVKGIDIDPHSVIVANYGSAKENFDFLAIEGSDRKRHIRAIVKSRDVETNLRCLIQLNITETNLVGHLKVIFNSADNEAKYEATMWAKQKGILQELVKYFPPMGEFIKDIKSKKITVGYKEFKFLNRNNTTFNQ